MANKIIEQSCIKRSRTKVAANSTAVSVGDFVTMSGGFITSASTTANIDGIAVQGKTYASDNQTVAKATLEYIVQDPTLVVRVAISGGTITAADEGKFYSLGANAYTVDGTTESTKAGTLQMIKFISATLADFAIVNKTVTV